MAVSKKKVITVVISIAVFSLALTEFLLLILSHPSKFTPSQNQIQNGGNVTFVVENINTESSMDSYAADAGSSSVTPYLRGQMSYFYPEGAIRTSWKRYNNVEHYIITGYAFIAGETIYKQEVSLVLLDENTGQYYKIHTEVQRREDVTSSFAPDGCNYDLSGIRGNVSKNYLQENHVYRIYLLYNNSFLVKSDYCLNEEVQ